MKKRVLVGLLGLVGLMGCVNGNGNVGTGLVDYGMGGENACQFVKEQVPELREDIESVEVVEEDSLLSDSWLAFDRARFAIARSNYLKGEMSSDEYMGIIDERRQILSDVQNSWVYGIVVNDSLKTLKKYDNVWRRVYKVNVKMKSGVIKEPRVLMDNDGETPRMLEKDFEMELDEYRQEIIDALGDLTY